MGGWGSCLKVKGVNPSLHCSHNDLDHFSLQKTRVPLPPISPILFFQLLAPGYSQGKFKSIE